MKPAPFTYFAPDSLDEALALRREHAGDSVVLAGGQSLLPILNLRLARPGVVIDIGRVPGLDAITVSPEGVAIGARVRQRDAERSPIVRQRTPLLAAALPLVAHAAIRNRGTIGGSLAHADPAAELPAVALALDAGLVVRSAARGARVVPASEFFHGFLATALEPDELLVEVRITTALQGAGTSFLEVARTHGAFAVVGAAAIVLMRDGVVAEARLVFIGVGATAIRSPDAEVALVGQEPSAEAFAAAAAIGAAGLDPVSDIHASATYRRRAAEVLARRALVKAAAA